MSNRSAKFAAALAASIMAGANFGALAQNAATTASTGTATARTADSCQSAPKGAAPAGSHWFYHLDRSTQKKCWYLGDAKNKVARTATARPQPAAAPDTATADATPPQSQPAPQPAMRKSIADARAEWPSPQAGTAPIAVAGIGQPDNAAPVPAAAAAPRDANAQSSDANARWLDASSMAGTNGTQHAADQPAVVAQADTTPQQAAAPAPAVPATAEAPAEKSSSSTQMLLIVMIGALALAGLVSALVFRLTRTPPYQISDEWRAPWDSLHTEPVPPMAVVNRDRPLRLTEATPRRAETPVPRRTGTPALRRETARETGETEQDNEQIAAMLQRLARSAAN